MVFLASGTKALPGGVVFPCGFTVSLKDLRALEAMPDGAKFYSRSHWFIRSGRGFKVGSLEIASVKILLDACKAAAILDES